MAIGRKMICTHAPHIEENKRRLAVQMQKGQIRTHTNEQIMKKVSEIPSTDELRKDFIPLSKRIEDRAIKLLGKVIRQAKTEPEAEPEGRARTRTPNRARSQTRNPERGVSARSQKWKPEPESEQ